MILRQLGFGAAALAIWGCGKSVQHVPLPSGGDAGSSATGGAGGTGGDVESNGGSGASSGASGGSSPEGGNGGTSVAGAPAAGMGGMSALLCPGTSYVRVKGELPGFGTDVSFDKGCARSKVAPYPTAASFAVGRGKAVHVEIDACSDDGTEELSLTVYFQADSNGQATLVATHFDFPHLNADGTATSPALDATVSVTETKKPVTNWIDTINDRSAGVGAMYEGSFTVDGSSGSTAIHVTGTFAVCHVADLPDDSV